MIKRRFIVCMNIALPLMGALQENGYDSSVDWKHAFVAQLIEELSTHESRFTQERLPWRELLIKTIDLTQHSPYPDLIQRLQTILNKKNSLGIAIWDNDLELVKKIVPIQKPNPSDISYAFKFRPNDMKLVLLQSIQPICQNTFFKIIGDIKDLTHENLEILLSQGFDINALNSDGETLLNNALLAWKKRREELLAKLPEPCRKKQDLSILGQALETYVKHVGILLAHGAQTNLTELLQEYFFHEMRNSEDYESEEEYQRKKETTESGLSDR